MAGFEARPLRIALVHDFLMQMGGGEKLLEVLHEMYPSAPVYTSAYDPEVMPDRFRKWDIRTSFLQRLWWKRKTHRLALALYPIAFESFDFSDYDLVISSTTSFAKGVVTGTATHHLCYTNTPMRYAWTTGSYSEHEQMGRLARLALVPTTHYLRLWDAVAASRVDTYIANSSTVARRIQKYYRRASRVIHPPVETGNFSISERVEDYYLAVARLIPYKRLDLAVDAFSRLKIPLKVVGTGRQLEPLRARAGSCVSFLGHVSDADLAPLFARARGYVMPGEEDFGISPVEANASGRPVIAYAAGGALDTQINGETGILFEEQTVDCLCDAVCRAERMDFDSGYIRDHSLRFDTSVFISRIREAVADVMSRPDGPVSTHATVRTLDGPGASTR